MKKAIIFDLNGVFIQSPKLSERFQSSFGVSVADFLAALKDVMSKVRLAGADDCYSYWKPYLDSWKVNISREDFYDFWFNAEKPNQVMVDLAKELKSKGFKIFILSNNFRERAAFYERNFPFLKEIAEKIYYSWQTNYVKSDKRAYMTVLEENKLLPQDAIFFDDSEDNIKLATSLGITSHIFVGPEDVRSKLGL